MTEPREEEHEFDGDARFAQLVIMLSSAAMQHLGKLVHPSTGKAELDFESARLMIDLIEMLDEKTRGNRTKQEDQMMSETLLGLRMNFVQAVEAAQGAAATAATAPEAPAADAKPDAPAEKKPFEAGPKKGDDEGKKFHKSYG